MSLSEVLLFVSTASPNSKPCIEFVTKHNMPVQLIKLDTRQQRERVMRGKVMQITHVPTLVLVFSDGNTQHFSSIAKVIPTLQRILSSMNDPPSRPSQPSKSREPVHAPSVIEESSSDDDFEPIVIAPSPPPKRSKKKKSKKKKKEKQPIVKEYEENSEEDTEIEFLSDAPPPNRKPPPPSSGLLVGQHAVIGQKSQMKSIASMAAEMEKQRQASLGYDEKDLPSNGGY